MATPDLNKEERTTAGFVAGGSIAEALGGLAAITLAVLALADVAPVTLAAVAAIAVGLGLALQGGSIMANYRRLRARMSSLTPSETEIGGETSVEMLGGIAGIVLGVLALVDVEADILLPLAVILFGAILLMSAGLVRALSDPRLTAHGEAANVHSTAEDAAKLAATVQTIAGVAAVALGILALLGVWPLTMTIVGLLACGISLFFSGTSVGAHMVNVLAH